MTVKEFVLFLRRLSGAENPPAVMVWGPPGVGKSQAVRDLAQELGWGHCDVRLPDHNPVDLKGVPFPDFRRGLTRWLPNGLLPVAERDGERGFLVLDEVTSAPPAVQVCAYQLTLDRRVGEYVLPPGWLVILAGNRAEDRGVTYRMPAPLANRLVHLEVHPDFQTWKEWAFRVGIDRRVISFLDFRPKLLHKMPQDPEIKAFPTPRSWEFVSRLLKAGFSRHDREAIAGCVGEGPAAEFIAFLKVAEEIPDPDAILKGKNVPPPGPERPDLLYALLGALVERLWQALRDEREFRRKTEIFLRWIGQLPGEFGVCGFVNLLLTVGKESPGWRIVMSLPETSRFADKVADLLV